MTKTKTKLPDGRGGWIEVEGEAITDAKADDGKQQKALEQQFYEDAGMLTSQFWKIGRLFQNENNLTDEHIAFAVALLGINVRETFPKGAEAFDNIQRAAWAYYDTTDTGKKK